MSGIGVSKGFLGSKLWIGSEGDNDGVLEIDSAHKD